MNETLEAMAQAIFKDWFVDFGPTRAKAEGQAPYLAPEIWELFPDALDDDDKPVGWDFGTVANIANVTSGKRPTHREGKQSLDFPIPLYGGAGQMAYVREPLYENRILLTGRVGTLGIIHQITQPSWPSDNTLVIIPQVDADFDYIYCLLKEIDFSSLNCGSTQPLVTQTDIKNQVIVKPPRKILDRYAALTCSLMTRIDANNQANGTLAQLRDLLLPKLMSGEIRLCDAEKVVEAVA